MNERDMLAILCQFISKRAIVEGDERSIKDMEVRYKFPPFLKSHPVAMRFTHKELNELNAILKQAHALLASTDVTPKSTPIVNGVELLNDDFP